MVVIVAALVTGAFYVTLATPSGADILKLFPDFPSNHGLTCDHRQPRKRDD